MSRQPKKTLRKAAGPGHVRGQGPGVKPMDPATLAARQPGQPGDWMGPGSTVSPYFPLGSPGRAFQYRVGQNLQISPRAGETLSFWQMRALAEECTILQQITTKLKAEILAQDWGFKVKAKPGESAGASTARTESDPRVKELNAFFQYPGRSAPGMGLFEPESDFETFLSKILDDLMVIDAVAIEPRKTNGGEVYAFDYVDPSTITLKINTDGRRPAPPEIAFQQILYGIPANDFTSEELLYFRRSVRSYKLYGHSPVEKLLLIINTQELHALDWLNFYTTGNVPLGFINGETGWTPEQIKQYQEWLDEFNDLERRAGLTVIPADAKYQAAKIEFARRIEEAEWLAREICAGYGVSPSAYVKQVNRATAQNASEEEDDQALIPWARASCRIINTCKRTAFGPKYDDVEFEFRPRQDPDAEKQAGIDKVYLSTGVYQIDEVRAREGKEPLGLPPGIVTPTGYVPFPSDEEIEASRQRKINAPPGPQPPGQPPSGAPPDEPPEKPEKIAAAGGLRKKAYPY